MGLLSWLFPGGGKKSREVTASIPHVAPGRGYTINIVGESHHQDVLDRLAGGKCEEGCKLETIAELSPDDANSHDSNAVAVFIRQKKVGYIVKEDASSMRLHISRLNPSGLRISCNAKIVGGWIREDGDEGHYGVKLSMSKTMQVRP